MHCLFLTGKDKWILSLTDASTQLMMKQNLINKQNVSLKNMCMFQKWNVYPLHISRSRNKSFGSTYITNLLCVLGCHYLFIYLFSDVCFFS